MARRPFERPESRATRSVIRALRRDRKDLLWHEVWEQFPLDTWEAFAESATRWLGDKSQLGTRTIESADWPEIYRYFKALSEAP